MCPSSKMPGELDRSLRLINNYLLDPIDLGGKKATDRISKAKAKKAKEKENRRQRQRRGTAPSPLRDSDPQGSGEDVDLEERWLSDPEKLIETAKKTSKRKEKRKKEIKQFLSPQFIEGSLIPTCRLPTSLTPIFGQTLMRNSVMMTNSLPKRLLLGRGWRKKRLRLTSCNAMELRSGRRSELRVRMRTSKTKVQPDARDQEQLRLPWSLCFLVIVTTNDEWPKSALQKHLHSQFPGRGLRRHYGREQLAQQLAVRRAPRMPLLLIVGA
jgi:hypothetical protein